MPGPAPSVPIVLSGPVRAELEALCRAQKTPKLLYIRARIALLAADGLNNCEIAREVNLHRENVRTWRERFAEGGVIALADKPRSGRPPTFSPSAPAPAAQSGVLAAV